jgi:ribosomal protein S18 acetylase RimI-like enzyme
MQTPAMKESTAILAANDVRETVRFYRDVLGFEADWLWGDPPTFGGVRWGRVQLMFCQQPEIARHIEGHQHWLQVADADAMLKTHRDRGAPIISDIGNKPWGWREYIVRDVNGYHLRFAGPCTYEKPASALSTMPPYIEIVERLPTADEHMALSKSVGWQSFQEVLPAALAHSLFGVVALDTRDPARPVVGSARIVGDTAIFYYIQDVMVLPAYQNQRIGSAMMETLMEYIRAHAPKGAMVQLFTGKPGFYERHGFRVMNGMGLVI